jgi:hypothetical protein
MNEPTLIVALGAVIHLAIGTAICIATARATGHKWGLGASFAAAIIASVAAFLGTALLFTITPLKNMPGGLMDGLIVTLAVAFLIFNVLYFFTVGGLVHLLGQRIARWSTRS